MKNFFVIFFSIMVLRISIAQAAMWTDIAIVNPGAEVGDMAGWSFTGPMGVDNYEPQTMQPIYPHSGDWFFSAAQPTGILATMAQSVDVSSFSSSIDNGLALYDFGFWHQNEYWENAWDTGEGTIIFYDNVMNELGSYSTGEIGNDVWTLAEHQDYIPSNTRIIGFNFTSRRYSGSHINAFYDDISLRVGVDQEPIVPEPATFSLLGLGLLGLVFRRKWGQKK